MLGPGDPAALRHFELDTFKKLDGEAGQKYRFEFRPRSRGT